MPNDKPTTLSHHEALKVALKAVSTDERSELSVRLRALSNVTAVMGQWVGSDCDCRAYQDYFDRLQETIDALAASAESDELQRVADGAFEEYTHGI